MADDVKALVDKADGLNQSPEPTEEKANTQELSTDLHMCYGKSHTNVLKHSISAYTLTKSLRGMK